MAGISGDVSTSVIGSPSERRKVRVSAHPRSALRVRGSIRGTWWRVIAIFVAVVAAMGVSTFALTRAQHDVFAGTTTRIHHQIGGIADLQQELLKAEIPIGGVLYELGRSGDLEDQWVQFEDHQAKIDRGLSGLRAASTPGQAAVLRRTEAAWGRVVDGVTEARGLWGSGVVADALARGDDPFGPTVWAALGETQRSLAQIAVQHTSALGREVEQSKAGQAKIEAVIVAAVAVALALCAMSVWRLSRRVVRPLLSLGVAATRMRDGDLSRGVDLTGSTGREVGELAAAMDEMATRLNRTHGRLKAQADTDALTGLANRRALTEVLSDALEKAADDRVAVLLIDLDDFKFVNDSMGHGAGDEVLVAVAGRLRSCARKGDVVARIGGDEFAVVVHGEDETLLTASALADRILLALADPIEVDRKPVRIGCSIGIALGAAEVANADDLIRNADAAMYMAKSRGKHCAGLFDPSMHAAMVSRVELRTDLARAAERDELELEYQPIIDLGSGEILGFEALVRWRHPVRGRLLPGDFIGLAEESGDILSIGRWVLDRACADLARYRTAAGPGSSLWMAVNVSGRQIAGGDFVGMVTSTLTKHGITPSSLVLELTEETIVVDTGQAAAVLNELRGQGVRVAVDDFGTGFSSLRYLHELPIDCIKIDRSFVAEADPAAEHNPILEAIVAMGRGLGLELIAEGIELSSERDRLVGLGPMGGQGYLIARPMPSVAALDLVRGQAACAQTVAAR